jgi:cytochrome P450
MTLEDHEQVRDVAGSAPSWDPVQSSDIFADYAALRLRCPVAHSGRFGGFWILLGYQEVAQAALQHKVFRSGQPFVELPDFTEMIPLCANPPEHSAYRRVLNKYFTQARMDELEPTIRAAVVEHLEPMIRRGGGELVADLARPVPNRSLCALLNMPESAWQKFATHREQMLALGDDYAAINALVTRLFDEQIAALITARRVEPRDPDRDLVSGVLAMAGPDGQPLPEHVAGAIIRLILAAGSGTTTSAMTGAFALLSASPADQDRLRREPRFIPSAVEEYLRLEPSLHALARTTAEPVNVDGVQIPGEQLVALNFASANRDPREFEDPEACRVDRHRNRHLTFGAGVHKCLGAPLARLELRVFLEELLARTSQVALAGPPSRVPGFPFEGGYPVLHVQLTSNESITE